MSWTNNHSNDNGSEREHRRLRTFVVDDLPQIVATLTRFLQLQPGFEVIGSAGSAVEALAQCAVLKPDLVLMDEELPDFVGSHCARLIREQHPAILIVLMSGHESLEWQAHLGYSGSVGFVAKTRLHRDLIPDILRMANQPCESILHP